MLYLLYFKELFLKLTYLDRSEGENCDNADLVQKIRRTAGKTFYLNKSK